MFELIQLTVIHAQHQHQGKFCHLTLNPGQFCKNITHHILSLSSTFFFLSLVSLCFYLGELNSHRHSTTIVQPHTLSSQPFSLYFWTPAVLRILHQLPPHHQYRHHPLTTVLTPRHHTRSSQPPSSSLVTTLIVINLHMSSKSECHDNCHHAVGEES